jgi:hypothetical protein
VHPAHDHRRFPAGAAPMITGDHPAGQPLPGTWERHQ